MSDVLATGLRTRLATIAQVYDPHVRHLAEWQAVKDYTAEALGLRAADRSRVVSAARRDRFATVPAVDGELAVRHLRRPGGAAVGASELRT